MARIAFAAAAAASGTLLLSMSAQQGGWIMILVTWGAAVLAAVRPFNGLLVLAGLGPVVTIFSILVGANTNGVHFTEALTLAFLTGATARRATVNAPLAVPARIALPAVVLIAAAVASAIVQSAVLGAEQREPVAASIFLLRLVRNYLVVQNTATVAVQFASGLLLLLVVTDICRRASERWDRVLVMMVAGAAGAAVLNIVRLVTAAMRNEDVWATLIRFLGSSRVNVQFPDWNAAGSYFAMMLLIAAGFAARRLAYLVPVTLLAAALWLTGSRVALMAVPVTLAGSVLLVWRNQLRRNAALAAVLALAVVVIAAGWIWYPSHRNDPAMFSVTTRLVLWKAGIRMMASEPVFGVGLGRFYVLSPDYAGEMLQIIWRPHENAHNYFIQVLAELGVPGLALFLAVIGFSLRGVLRQGAAASGPSWGLAAGLVAFLLTCLTGHSLVVPDAAYPFWIALGVAASAGVAATYATPFTTRARIWASRLATAMIVVFLVTIPIRMAQALRHANRENTTVGLSSWQRDDGGNRFRWAEARSTLFVRSSGRAIRIPLRRGPEAPSEMQVRIFFDGKEADRVALQPGEDWRNLRIVRPRQGSDGAFFRIDLEVDGTFKEREHAGSKVLMVGQPTIVWDK